MEKKTKTKILMGSVIAVLGTSIGYALYSLKKSRAKAVDVEQITDDYIQDHQETERKYIDLTPVKEETEEKVR